jgi:hypothetical protein
LVFGDAFLRGFYSIHDNSLNRFGFVPHAESTKLAPQKGKVPKTHLKPYQKWMKGADAFSECLSATMAALFVTMAVL